MDADEIAARVRALVDAAPPLNAGQQAVIRAMLAPASTPPQVRGGEKARRESFEQIVRRPAA